ncbi:hypothetical protein DPMN_174800 [Dreissena polymorpha]|nr:hypothetical protein DPMN_174800 [Dreissena polymorpha]
MCGSESADGMEVEDSKDSTLAFTDQELSESQIEGLESGKLQLQELSLDQLGLGNQHGLTVSDGMVMLPMGSMGGLFTSADPQLVQIVNVNGHPTLQLVNPASLLHAQGTSLLGTGLSSDQMTLPTSISGASEEETRLQDQLEEEAQLVALQNPDGSSQAHMMGLSLENIIQLATSSANAHTTSALPVSGYQSLAVLPTEGMDDQSDVNYVLIINPNGDNDTLQGTTFNFGNNVQGELVDETMDETGATRRLVRINRLPKGDDPPGTIACSMCSFKTTQEYAFKRHVKSHKENRPHKCGLCNRAFKTMSSLQNHINTHTGVRPHKCKLCESAFTTSGELVRHIRYRHTFEKPHKCTVCEYASVELSKLKRHMRSHTGERPYCCMHCNYASPDTYKLKRHMRIHTGERPYECNICGTKFTQSNSLKAHKLIHTGNKPVFQCSLCPTTCGRKNDLKVHMEKLHGSNEQPLVCKKCDAEFHDRYSFKMHIKTHDGDKCHKCPSCDFTAPSRRSVDMHMMVHNSQKSFECEHCNLVFQQPHLLHMHLQQYHDEEADADIEIETTSSPCKECDKNCLNIKSPDNLSETRPLVNKGAMLNLHTCGGCPKTMIQSVAPLTTDQLLDNGLLDDMKEGRLGNCPKVVVVHPDGRVEEVTAKLQSLSQSKPMDDFLVSLGVSGDSHFDQVSSLPSEVNDSGVHTLISATPSGHHGNLRLSTSGADNLMSINVACRDTNNKLVFRSMSHMDETREESVQASFDSSEDLDQESGLHINNEQDTDEEVDVGDDTKMEPDQGSLVTSMHVPLMADFR